MTVKVYPITLSDFVPNTIYMHDKNGRFDLLGQILTHMEYIIPVGTKHPAELSRMIPPFTKRYRNTIMNSEATLALLANNHLPPESQLRAANTILAKYNIELVSEKDYDPEPKELTELDCILQEIAKELDLKIIACRDLPLSDMVELKTTKGLRFIKEGEDYYEELVEELR